MQSFRVFRHRFVGLILPLALGLLGLGCGGSDRSPSTKTFSSTASSTSALHNGIGVPVGTGTSSSGSNPLQFQIEGTGYDTQVIQVQAGQVLRIQYAPRLPTRPLPGTTNPPRYSQMGVYFIVGSVTKDSGMLATGGGTQPSQKSQIIDMSSGLTACSGKAANCRTTVIIQVTKPNNDGLCLSYGSMYCPWTRNPDGYPWSGVLTVQTDDTSPL